MRIIGYDSFPSSVDFAVFVKGVSVQKVVTVYTCNFTDSHKFSLRGKRKQSQFICCSLSMELKETLEALCFAILRISIQSIGNVDSLVQCVISLGNLQRAVLSYITPCIVFGPDPSI